MFRVSTDYGEISLRKITKITVREDKTILEADVKDTQIITRTDWTLDEIEEEMRQHHVGDCEINVYHYDSNQLEWQYFLKHGHTSLLMTKWMYDGTKVDEITMVFGKRHGVRKGYYVDGGKLKYKYKYFQDKEHGLCIEYDKHTGFATIEREYDMGKEIVRRYYNEDGSLDTEAKLD